MNCSGIQGIQLLTNIVSFFVCVMSNKSNITSRYTRDKPRKHISVAIKCSQYVKKAKNIFTAHLISESVR